MKPYDADPIDELLKQRAQTAGAGAPACGPLCGDAELLAAYVENSLDAESRERLMEHLSACAACRDEVAALVRLAPREAVVETKSPAWWTRWIWVPALAALVVTGSIVLTNRERIVRPPATPPASEEKPIVPQAAPAEPTDIPLTPPVVARKKAPHPQAPVNGPFAPAPAMPQKDEKTLSLDAANRKEEPLQLQPGTAQRDQLTTEAANAPPPAPQANNMQNQIFDRNGVVAGNLQAGAAGGGGGRGGASAASVRSAPAAAPPPPPMPRMPPMDALARQAAAPPVKGRIEKDALEISTDGGTTWEKIVTPEPAVSVRVDDALHFEIHCKSTNVFRTKDGGKTWEQQKPPQ